MGESIRGENISEEPLALRLYVLTISDLPFMKKEGYLSNYKVIFSSTIEKKLYRGKFEVEYPKHFPPTISSKHFKTRCSLLIGKPKLGGRILFPRKEIRMKILPSYSRREEITEILKLNKIAFESGDEVIGEISLKKGEKEVSSGILIEEWYKEREKKFQDEYSLCEGNIDSEKSRIILKLPPDPTMIKDVFLFYPYCFAASSSRVEFGIRAYLLIEATDKVVKKEIAIVPRKPVFVAERILN